MGFFAVLAASLFAVFLFTVFGGYSLLLSPCGWWFRLRWCWLFWCGRS